MHRMTKMHKRADSKSEITNEEIVEANAKQAEKLIDLGFISGGVWAVAEGDSYTGTLRAEPTVGNPVFLDGSEWFRSSPVAEIAQETEKSWIIKTANSYYLLEDLSR